MERSEVAGNVPTTSRSEVDPFLPLDLNSGRASAGSLLCESLGIQRWWHLISSVQLSAADGAHEAEDVEVEVLGLPDEVGRMKDLATARAARREASGTRIEPVTLMSLCLWS